MLGKVTLISLMSFYFTCNNELKGNIPAYQIWEKLYAELDNEDWKSIEIIIETMDLGQFENDCKLLHNRFKKLQLAIENKERDQVQSLLTQYILNKIRFELRNLDNVENYNDRKLLIRQSFLELNVIQDQLKSIDFEIYRDAVITIRSLNRYVGTNTQLKDFTSSNAFLNTLKC